MEGYDNILLNGLKIPVPKKSSIKKLIERFFDLRCEFLVSINSKPIPTNKYATRLVKENDILQIASYSKYCYKLHKRTIFKEEHKKGGQII